MKTAFLKIFCLFCLIISLPILNAQAQATASSNVNLGLSLNPANPAPGDRVTATLQSFSLDLDRAAITWSVNGIEKQTDLGLKSYSLQAGTAGLPITVSARVQTTDGTNALREISFIPAGVDLLFEAVSYTPPFYKGKAMNTNQGTVVVVAFPEMFTRSGKKISTQNLVYNWKKDGVAVAAASGAGKNYFTYSGTIPVRDVRVEVTVSSSDGTIVANNSTEIAAGSPKIVFYENSPIYGIMTNKAIRKTVQMLTDEFSLVAVPYFFSIGYAGTPDLDYGWSLNGRTVPTQDPKNSFTVRQETKGSGTANIGLKINNNVRIFQFADNALTINFQK